MTTRSCAAAHGPYGREQFEHVSKPGLSDPSPNLQRLPLRARHIVTARELDRFTLDRHLEGSQLSTMRDEVRAGLTAPQKSLPSKYFYDAVGSELFEKITELPVSTTRPVQSWRSCSLWLRRWLTGIAGLRWSNRLLVRPRRRWQS